MSNFVVQNTLENIINHARLYQTTVEEIKTNGWVSINFPDFHSAASFWKVYKTDWEIILVTAITHLENPVSLRIHYCK